MKRPLFLGSPAPALRSAFGEEEAALAGAPQRVSPVMECVLGAPRCRCGPESPGPRQPPGTETGLLPRPGVALLSVPWQSSSSSTWQHWVFSKQLESLAACVLPRWGGRVREHPGLSFTSITEESPVFRKTIGGR